MISRRITRETMHRRHYQNPTPWLRETDPSVPQPSETGRTILRMWIDNQLKLISARTRPHRTWHHRRPRH